MQDNRAAAAQQSHMLTVDNRTRANLTGITAVDSFNERQVVARLSQNGIIITGENLIVTKFNTENGTLTVDGMINEIKYTEGTGGKAVRALKKLFK